MPGPPRAAVPNTQKLALRQYRRNNPLLKLSELAAWFHSEYGRTVTVGQISSWLGPSYDRLDTSGDVRTDLKRKRPEKWPKLESALYTGVKWYEAKGGVITAKVIRMMAERLWKRIDEYKDMPLPSLSNGWIDGFKGRYGIKKRRRDGELGSVDDDEAAIAMEQIVVVTDAEALHALQVLTLYGEQQGYPDMVSMLQRHENTLRQRQQASMRQSDLSALFNNNNEP